MNSIDRINDEKNSIINKISNIDSMRKGSINKQIIKSPLKDGSIKENGPYYILTTKDSNGKTITESIAREELDFYAQEVEKYKEFKDLTNRFEYLSEELSRLKSDTQKTDGKLKKNKRTSSAKK
jgi:hypothetical protein